MGKTLSMAGLETLSCGQAAVGFAGMDCRGASKTGFYELNILRPVPACPWWPFVWSQQTKVRVGDDG
jgi:hypothetical protein